MSLQLQPMLSGLTQATQWNEGKNHRRRLFLSELASNLVLSKQNRRLNNPKSMQKDVKMCMDLLGFIVNVPVLDVPIHRGQRRCCICPRNRDRKVTTSCSKCGRA